MTTQELIIKASKFIQKYAPKYNIKVCSPILSQMLLESARGTSELAVNANNYFGIKYKEGRCPTATGIYYKIGSEQNADGSYVSSSMKWCKFANLEGSIVGYFDFINNANYSNLKGVTNPKTYLENIKKDGYATSLKYVDNLLSIINKYNLTKYDTQTEATKTMAYTNSPLTNYTKISPNRTSPRNHVIDRLTVHCFVGQVTAKRGCEVFQNKSRNASCNYVIGKDGDIGLCVEEKDRSWCSSNKDNDMRAITFEVASDSKPPYAVTDAALNALIDLITDICNRNGKKKVLWFADKNKTLAYNPKPDEMVMTVHRWFAAKACPGDYLYGKHAYIAEQVNKRLGSVNTTNSAVNTIQQPFSSTQSTSKFTYQNIDYSLVFNPTYYANKYADLKKAFGANATALFNHFCTNGMKEGRIASSNFNVTVYKNNYADLRNAFGNNLPLYYKHYITNGYKEKRKCV